MRVALEYESSLMSLSMLKSCGQERCKLIYKSPWLSFVVDYTEHFPNSLAENGIGQA